MARDKKSLFEWLTGGAGNEGDYSFDDLESGGSSYAPPVVRKVTPTRGPQSQQTPTHIIIKAMIAGVRPEDLDVSITRDMVTIRGKREQHTEGTAGDFFFQELYWGTFSRTIVLPQEVEIEEAEASEKHGLLSIKLPKLDKGRQAKLKVKSN
jgi:HSP20 family molecular chaperone IbpA